MRSLCFLVVFCCCANYQPSPYAEVQYRDETLGSSIHDEYNGTTFMVGVRYVPPVIVSDFPVLALPYSLEGQKETVVNTYVQEEEKKSAAEEVKEAVEIVKDADWTWPMVAALIVVAWIIREFKRKPKEK